MTAATTAPLAVPPSRKTWTPNRCVKMGGSTQRRHSAPEDEGGHRGGAAGTMPAAPLRGLVSAHRSQSLKINSSLFASRRALTLMRPRDFTTEARRHGEEPLSE